MLININDVDSLVKEDSLEIPFCNKVPNSELSRSDDNDEVCRVF